MNKKLLSLALIMALTLVVFVPAVNVANAQNLGPGQMIYVMANIAGGPQTVDPAQAYDTASCELIQNVYDPSVFLNGTNTDKVVPWLADSWVISPDGQNYTFHIRTGVQWQDPVYGMVTPEDVQYSLQRVMVRDYVGGPAWMFYLPIFGTYGADTSNALAQGLAIAAAVTRDDVAGTVTILLNQSGYAYLPSKHDVFVGILAQTVGSIVSKQWCIDNGDWPGTGLNDGTWAAYHAPSVSPFDDPTNIMMGSGPFEFNFLTPAVSWSIIRNGGQDGSVPGTIADPHPTTIFWGGWDTTRANLLGFSGKTSRGYLDEIREYFISNYATRLAGFVGQSPIYDSIIVPRYSVTDVWNEQGIRCIYTQAELALDAMFFGFDVGLTSPYIGTPTGYGYFGENGITPDFFSDIHCRKAIAYSFDWTQYISSAWRGEAQQVGIPLPTTLPFYNPNPALMYSQNIPAAIAEWQLAWGGQVWANGFRFSIVYNEGNVPRQTAAEMMKAILEAENPKFQVEVVSVPWNQYGNVWHGGPNGRAQAPIFINGWLSDYPDADDWATPFMESTGGTFAYPQHVDMDPNSGVIDNLIESARYAPTPAARFAFYQPLWQLYHDEVLSLPLEEPLGRRWARDWVHGWYFNQLFSGSAACYVGESLGSYFYTMWKDSDQNTGGWPKVTGKQANWADSKANEPSVGALAITRASWEDITEDGKVDIKDLATAAKAFGGFFIQPALAPYPAGPPGTYSANWNSRADINLVDPTHPDTSGRGDMKVDIKDLATIAKLYGFVADPWTPGP